MKYRGRKTSSRFRGVSFHPMSGKYEARISVQNVKHFLGLFDDDISAAIVYDAFAVRFGVGHRINGAADQYANETAQVAPVTQTVCSICNGAKFIASKKLSNGDWLDGPPIPCPLCQTQLSVNS